jgi:cold shock CspA family protein
MWLPWWALPTVRVSILLSINRKAPLHATSAWNTSISADKRENEKKRLARRAEKQKKKEEKKLSNKANSFEDMIAYVDENGMITSTPPAENTPKEEIKLEEIVISTPKKDKEEPVIRRGRIEFFNESKGFGFIKDLSGVEKYFFHINNVLTDIAENNIVTFDLERGLKGMNAVNVALEVEKAKEKKENKETLNTES